VETITVEKDGSLFEISVSSAHRQGFEARHGLGSLVRLYRLLAQDCRSFVEVGREFGLTRERIRQIYKTRLAQYLPRKSGHERTRACTLARVHVKPWPKQTLMAWRLARQAGLHVSHMNYVRSNGVVDTFRRILLVNGKRCKIHFLTNEIKCGYRCYARIRAFSPSLKKDEFQIFIVQVKGFDRRVFVAPSKTILAAGYSDDLYLSLERKPVYKNHRPRIDWWQYENAWNLLKDD
jgi:hypothetical protein